MHNPHGRFASIYLIKPPYTGGIPGKQGEPPVHIAQGVRNTGAPPSRPRALRRSAPAAPAARACFHA